MPLRKVLFREQAELDLVHISDYSLAQWGAARATRYMTDLSACCRQLADNPYLGRACYAIRPGLRRMEQGKHVIFYRPVATGILVSRVLHERMLPEPAVIEREQDKP